MLIKLPTGHSNLRLDTSQYMARKPKADTKTFVPFTDFQRWLAPVLKAKGWEPADLARAMNRDYNYVYKIARVDPSANDRRNNVPQRPGYETAYEIGVAVGDVIGAIVAAGYPLPDQISTVTEGQTLTLFAPSSGQRKPLFIGQDLLQRLLLESELQEKGIKGA